MPAATDLVVKNAAGTDKTFTLLYPSAGLGSVAEWALKEGATATVYPTFQLSARKTGNRSKRVPLGVRVPASYTSVTTGLPVVSSTFEFHGVAVVPDDFPDNQKDDAVAYVKNLVGHALVVACMRNGVPAT